MKSKRLSQNQNISTTITTLREHANQMLNVANHLEATEKWAGSGINSNVRAGIPPGKRKLSIVARRKIGKGVRARAAKGNQLPVVGKTA
jgi:hypothetical protein